MSSSTNNHPSKKYKYYMLHGHIKFESKQHLFTMVFATNNNVSKNVDLTNGKVT